MTALAATLYAIGLIGGMALVAFLVRTVRDRREHQALVSTLELALESERERLGAEQAGFVAEYIAHGEFGLAHEHIVDALADLNLMPLDRTSALLEQAAAAQETLLR